MKHTFDLCAWWTIFSLSERKKKSCLFTKIILNLRFKLIKVRLKGFPGGASGKGSTNEGDTRDEGSISGSGRSPGEGNDTPSSILAWKIPQTDGPGGLQPMGSQSQTQVSAHTQSEMRCVVSWGGWQLGRWGIWVPALWSGSLKNLIRSKRNITFAYY